MLKNIKRHHIAEALLLFTLITLPLPEHWNSKVLLLSLIFVLYSFYKDFNIEFPKIAWVYILFFVFAGLSYFWSMEKSETMMGIVSLLPFLLFTIAYRQFFIFQSIDKILRLTSIVFLFYGFIWLIFAYFRFTQNHKPETFYYHELTAPFGANAIYIALIFGQLYIFLLYNILFSINKIKPLDLLLIALLFGFQILLSSKMILSILVLISIIFFIKYLQKSGSKKKVFAFGFVLILFASLLFGISSFTKNRFKNILNYEQIENVFTSDYFGRGYYWNGLSLRLFQLRCFYEIETNPDFNSFTGTGFSAGQSPLNEKYAQYDLYRGSGGEGENDGYFVYNFHNQYAQLLIELGFFGGILIVLMLFFFVLYPIKNKNILLLAIGLLLLSFALTESYLLRQKGIVSFVLFPLLSVYYFNKDRQSDNDKIESAF